MSVKLENFVSVNIKRHIGIPAQLEYNCAVYVDGTITEGYYAKNGTGTGASKTDPKGISEITDPLVKTFFDNGGKYLHVVDTIATGSGTTMEWSIPLDEIVIFKNPTASGTIVGWNTVASGIYQKVFLNETTTLPSAKDPSKAGIVNFKVSTASASSSINTAVAAIAAYYTKIDLAREATIRDLSFTAVTGLNETNEITESNADVVGCAKWCNCAIELANAVRIIGGNDLAENDVTNLIMMIIVQQRLAKVLVELLASKIKVNTNGVASTKTVIINELNRFVANGYISLDKAWDDDDLYIGDDLIISRGNILTGGFLVYVAPITPTNVTNHTIPDIYVIYGDSVGVRKITLSGEVF